MRSTFRVFAFLAVAIGFMVSLPALAQSTGQLEAGVEYNYLRTASLDSIHFSLNGGNAWVGYRIRPAVLFVGEVAGQHAGNINNSGADLTLTSFLIGPRYTLKNRKRVTPFGELLMGFTHAYGSLSPANSGLDNSSNAFTMATGGGFDVSLTKHISLRAFRADYILTKFSNGDTNYQNNLRIGAGVVFKFQR